ncbi:MAG: hypothetical protein KH230_16870 [Enterocloster asparagiformis]|nr:hypothetical protein [Enterocloster asparagiformis]
MFKKREEGLERTEVVINEGSETHVLHLGRPEGAEFVRKLLLRGATRVEITMPLKFDGSLEHILEALSDERTGLEHIAKPNKCKEERALLYEAVAEQYGELRKIEAIGIADSFNKQHAMELVTKGIEDNSGKTALYMAALLRIMGEAAKNIDYDTLTSDERRMLGGNFIKDLEGLKRYLGL